MKNEQQGVALVEFALVLPVLLILAALTIDLGRAVFRYNTTVKTVRDAARYLSVQAPNSHQTETRNLIVYGNTAGTGAPLDPMLTATMVKDPVWKTEGTAPVINTVTVRIQGYQFQPISSSWFGTAFSTLTYSDITATMRTTQ